MAFKYSICYPLKPNIEYPSGLIDEETVLEIAKNHPWRAELASMQGKEDEDIYYSPSLDFTEIKTQRSFCLTAQDENGSLKFSLWYRRPKNVKIFFGLLGERKKMVLDTVWSYSFEESLRYLQHFTTGNYQILEYLYK